MNMEKQIAVFDFDGTLIRGDSVVALLFFACKKGRLSLAGLIGAGWYGLLYRVHLTDVLTAKMAFRRSKSTGSRATWW